MSGNLSLSGIRAGAMAPPEAGQAQQYQDMLWEQMVGETERARRAETARLEEEGRRALDRSGIYNVGSFMVPQDAGEVALSAAMGPGLGRAARTILAGLGGLTTQVGDAEGALFTLPQWMRAARTGVPRISGRQQIEERMEGLEPALRSLRGAEGAPLRNPAQYTGDELNRAFEDVSFPTFTNYGWLPFPDPQRNYTDLLGAATGDRYSWPTGNIMSGFRVGQAPRRLEEELQDDLLYAAEPGLRETRMAYGNLPGNLVGAYVGRMNGQPGNIFMRPSQPNMNEVQYHEIQHGLQDLTGRARGGTVRTVAENNPDMYERYLERGRDLYTPATAEQGVRLGMYTRLPGEWEARMAGRLSANRQSQLDQMTIEELLGGTWPDFNLRGVGR